MRATTLASAMFESRFEHKGRFCDLRVNQDFQTVGVTNIYIADDVRSSITGSALSGRSNQTAKINSLLCFVGDTENKKLKAAVFEDGDKTCIAMVRHSSTGEDHKAYVEMTDNNFSITTDAQEGRVGQLTGDAFGLLLFTNKGRSIWPMTRAHFENEIAAGELNAVFDALYYELKKYEADNRVLVSYSFTAEANMDTFFDRISAFEDIRVPDTVRKLIPTDTYPGFNANPQSAAANVPVKDEVQEYYNECVNGSHRIFRALFIAAEDRIPPLDSLKKYAPTKEFVTNCKRVEKTLKLSMAHQYAVECPIVLNMMFYGAPGTGKTQMARAIAAALGLPVYQDTVTGQTEEGKFNLTPDFDANATLRNEEQVFRMGFANGGICILDEINLPKPDILMYLSGALESPYILGNGNKEVKRHAMTVVIGTCNPAATGTKDQNTAFLNRFSHWVNFEPTDKESLKRIVMAQRPDIAWQKEQRVLEKVVDTYMDFFDVCNKFTPVLPQLTTLLSFRSIRGVLNSYYDFGETMSEAFTETFINAVDYYVKQTGDPDLYAEFQQKIDPIINSIGKMNKKA